MEKIDTEAMDLEEKMNQSIKLWVFYALNLIVYAYQPAIGLLMTLLAGVVYGDYFLLMSIGLFYLEAHTPSLFNVSCGFIMTGLYIVKSIGSFVLTDKKLPLKWVMPMIVLALIRVIGIVNALYHPFFTQTQFVKGLIENILILMVMAYAATIVLDIGSRSNRQKIALEKPLLITLVISGVISGIFYRLQGQSMFAADRLMMEVHRPGKYVVLLAMAVLAIGYLLKNRKMRGWIKGVLVLSGMWILYIILLSGSRIGLILFFLAVTYSVVWVFRNRKVIWIYFLSLAGFALAIATLKLPFFASIQARLINPILSGDWAGLSPARVSIWLGWPEIVFANLKSALLGYGAFDYIEIRAIYGVTAIQKIAHNIVISNLIQIGIIGTAAYLLVCWMGIRGLKNKESKIKIFSAMAMLAMIGGMTDPVTYKEALWIFIGLGTAYRFREEKDEPRVLHVIPHFDLGGSEILVTGIVKHFRHLTAHVCGVLRGSMYQSMAKQLSEHGVAAMTLDKAKKRERISGIIKLVRYIEEQEIDYIHTHCPCPDFYGISAAILTNRPVYSTIHNMQGYSKQRMRIYSLLVNRFIAISDSVKGYMVEQLSMNPNQIVTIYNGIDIDRIDQVEVDRELVRAELKIKTEFLVLNVGRINEQKNHDMMIDAAKMLKAHSVDLTIVVAGRYQEDDDYYRRIVQRIRDESLEDCIKLIGQRHDVIRLMKSSDVLIMPSKFEGMSLALMEAIASKLPIVGTRVGTAEELLDDGVSAYLHAADNLEKMVHDIEMLLHDKKKADAMAGEAFKKLKDQYDLVYAAERYEALYDEDK